MKQDLQNHCSHFTDEGILRRSEQLNTLPDIPWSWWVSLNENSGPLACCSPALKIFPLKAGSQAPSTKGNQQGSTRCSWCHTRETSSGGQDVRCPLGRGAPAVIVHTASAKVLAALPVTCDLLTPQAFLSRRGSSGNSLDKGKWHHMAKITLYDCSFPLLGSLTVLRCMFKKHSDISIKI